MKCHRMFRLLFVCAVFIVTNVVADETSLIEQMKSGNAVLMIRHANAPGIGDPEYFAVNDCTTQRNLDNEGRDQAKAGKGVGDQCRLLKPKSLSLRAVAWQSIRVRCLFTRDCFVPRNDEFTKICAFLA